uniref:Myozenin 1 n=1 Tax=Pelusios castaneus TaxID=367368 RepID=A0A8C8RVL3_9SAUR
MPQEGSRLNLGKKISIPRDVMLEELSLLTNKGSKMFKLRQLRVEKFIYENHPDIFTDTSMDHFRKFVPSVGGHYGGEAHGYSHSSGRMVGGPGSKGGAGCTGADQTGSSAGSGGGVDGGGSDATGKGKYLSTPYEDGWDEKSGGGKKVSIFKTYISPWEQAMGVSPQEKSEFTIDLLSYDSKAELPHYKSFNRTAIPYGGYEKARKLMTFQMPEFDAGSLVPEPIIVYNQDINTRPSFNRTPIPWQGSGEPTEYNIEIKVPMDGETEEL